ncbi:MAG: ATP-binding cassette domain-containing protein [Candidatus Cloacimonas sp.]|jgi:ABC-type Mn2+/Zn2+ transport system ATPase subunit|nr:ATP-binding cassette domain-containing protein [Candidatus Cloacimonas sp.]
MISITNLSFAYPRQALLFSDFNLHLSSGESILLQGENGCGKSTLLKLIMGILLPLKGGINIGGKPAGKLDSSRFEHLFYQSQNTADNLLGISHLQDWQIWQIALPHLDFCPQVNDKLFSELSTGEKKQASQQILPYLMAKFWLLDEPFAGLDANAAAALTALLHKKKEQRPGMLIISHELNNEDGLFDRVMHLDKGQISGVSL